MSQPDLTELSKGIIAAAQFGVNTSMPCKVLKVNHSEGTVDVRPGTRRRRPNGTLDTYSDIGDVPVGQLIGGDMSVRLPIKVGDTGQLQFSDESTGNWVRTGELSDPPVGGGLNALMYLPVVQPTAHRQPIPVYTVEIGMAGSSITVEDTNVLIDSPTIELGTGGAGVARLGDTVRVTIPALTQVVDPNSGATVGPVDIDGTVTSASSSVTAKG